jgi:hypothetical protein
MHLGELHRTFKFHSDDCEKITSKLALELIAQKISSKLNCSTYFYSSFRGFKIYLHVQFNCLKKITTKFTLKLT